MLDKMQQKFGLIFAWGGFLKKYFHHQATLDW